MSADGHLLVFGAPFDGGDATGAAWVFERAAGGEWRQQRDKLVGTADVGSGQGSVALSADNATATLAVGGLMYSGDIGATWVFPRSAGGVWMQQGDKLVGTGGAGSPGRGTAVALSADGGMLAVGAPYDGGNAGAVWVFTHSSGREWTQVGTKIVGTGEDAATMAWHFSSPVCKWQCPSCGWPDGRLY